MAAPWAQWIAFVVAMWVLAAALWWAQRTIGEAPPPWADHAFGHETMLSVLAVGFLGVSWWRRARPLQGALGRWSPILLAGGLALVSAAQLTEAAGALMDQEGPVHGAGVTLTAVSAPVVLLGALLTVVAAARARALPWWLRVLLLAAGAAAAVAGFGLWPRP